MSSPVAVRTLLSSPPRRSTRAARPFAAPSPCPAGLGPPSACDRPRARSADRSYPGRPSRHGGSGRAAPPPRSLARPVAHAVPPQRGHVTVSLILRALHRTALRITATASPPATTHGASPSYA